MALVDIRGLDKGYRTGGEETRVLVGLDLQAEEGEMLMIMGPSGSGKTTLLNLLGGIDKPDRGTITVAGMDITGLDARALNRYRLERVGFIFQFYNLIPTLTAAENVELGIDPVIRDRREMAARARKYLGLVGLEDKVDNFPQELSAGEQQRVAVARALAKEHDHGQPRRGAGPERDGAHEAPPGGAGHYVLHRHAQPGPPEVRRPHAQSAQGATRAGGRGVLRGDVAR